MSTNGAQARGSWRVARKLAAGSVVVGVMVASAAGTAVAAPAGRSHDGGAQHGRQGEHHGQHGVHRRAVEGMVAKIDPSGGFTVVRGIGSVAVTVTAATVVVERGQSSPQVATGDRVVVYGTETAPGVLTATRVRIKAPEKAAVQGTVQSIATDGTSFTVARGDMTVTVDVSSTTIYATTAGSSATFSDLAVGDHVKARGTRGTAAFDATQVLISVPPQRALLGTVVTAGSTATSGSSTSSTAASSFTMSAGDAKKPVTVDVSSSTVYLEAGSTTATFSSLAAGDQVVVVGTVSDHVVQASTVVILSVPTSTPTSTPSS